MVVYDCSSWEMEAVVYLWSILERYYKMISWDCEWMLLCAIRDAHALSLCKKATILQVTTVLATSKNVLFPGHNHLLPTGTFDPTLWLLAKHY